MLGEVLLFAVVALISFTIYKFATHKNDYFEKRNIKTTSFKGNLLGLLLNKYTATEFAQRFYNRIPDEPIYGFFNFSRPAFFVRDPDIIKQITVKDFDHFEDHRGFVDVKVDTLWGNTLFFMQGEKWRQMRATLSPAFTGSKMRQMFELVAECADDVVKHFSKRIESGERANIVMKNFFTRYTNDVIASCAFGLKINSFADPENEFYLNGKKAMNFSAFRSLFKILLFIAFPAITRFFKVRLSSKSIARSFKNTIFDTMKIRKEKNIYRPDMINIMMQVRDGTLKHQKDEKVDEKDGFATVEESEVGKLTVNRQWNDDEIVGQCFVFFAAGFDTSSTLLTFVSYELTANPDIQQKLYEEIVKTDEKLGGKHITYDALQTMKYLDQVICETLRKWPPLVQNDRVCTKDYVFDNHDKLKFTCEKEARFIIPVYGLHHDPKYFPEPEKFDPERFSDENKNNILPGTFIPFGIGPRNCIGSRFALMEVKAILYYMLLKFSFEPNEKTEIPIKLKQSAFSMLPRDGMNLELKLRNT